MPDTLTKKVPDPLALDVVRELKARLQRRFGDRLVAVYLFGSRARGDHRPDSDTDVAVFLEEEENDPVEERYDVIDDSYDLLLERGLYIQPWTLPEGARQDPRRYRCGPLVASILRDGIQV
ncbi:nucleotidyltransferase domain-containing protein [Azospirillum sp.]|uniref:nucleotidyltransferase domain-containing protein n=1 Tax=Azospirillum sp. TaxID=34012 RepID=UPI002D322DAE|nr:nucleotidyltransferase domain-containing protein [Azospirillum sp.]HYD68441.1 nucleotidyltransferase domain-containing protein [Azospirillum sp.]